MKNIRIAATMPAIDIAFSTANCELLFHHTLLISLDVVVSVLSYPPPKIHRCRPTLAITPCPEVSIASVPWKQMKYNMPWKLSVKIGSINCICCYCSCYNRMFISGVKCFYVLQTRRLFLLDNDDKPELRINEKLLQILLHSNCVELSLSFFLSYAYHNHHSSSSIL